MPSQWVLIKIDVLVFDKIAATSNKRNAHEETSTLEPLQPKKKLKGDEEFERQMEMAMAATGMIVPGEIRPNEGALRYQHHKRRL